MKNTATHATLLGLALAAILWTIPTTVAAADITMMLMDAKTAADHEAIAVYFDGKAQAAKEELALHRKMLEVIKSRSGGPDIAK